MPINIGCSHPGAPDVVNLARLHAYQNGVFWLVDVPQKDAKDKQKELSRLGWTVVHTELV
jgi:hypothetical protein